MVSNVHSEHDKNVTFSTVKIWKSKFLMCFAVTVLIFSLRRVNGWNDVSPKHIMSKSCFLWWFVVGGIAVLCEQEDQVCVGSWERPVWKTQVCWSILCAWHWEDRLICLKSYKDKLPCLGNRIMLLNINVKAIETFTFVNCGHGSVVIVRKHVCLGAGVGIA